jgi:hypothetical protein
MSHRPYLVGLAAGLLLLSGAHATRAQGGFDMRTPQPPSPVDRVPQPLPDIPKIPIPTAPSAIPGLSAPNLSSVGAAAGGLGIPGSPRALGLDTDRILSLGAEATAQAQTLVQARSRRLGDLVAANPTLLDLDPLGMPIVRGQVVLSQPSAATLEAARAAGFSVAGEEALGGLGLNLIILQAPAGLSTREALERLRRTVPRDTLDYNHVYLPAGMSAQVRDAPRPATGARAISAGPRLGLIDTGVDQGHPALAAARVNQRGFAPGGPLAQTHGTAVASLMVGQAGGFRGAAPGAGLSVADVYGSGATGGSVDAIVRGLSWLGGEGTPVINISLVGPPNRILQAAVSALVRRGVILVAPVGNDGPAAAPMYPASYPGVVAVTAVDGRDRLLIEAGRALHVDFAAPGADMVAAKAGGGFEAVRGSSFAAPIVAGRLAAGLTRPDPTAAARSIAGLGRSAKRMGRDYGRGLVGAEVRIGALAGL